MRIIIIFLAILASSAAQAADIEGQISVLKKGGQSPLRSFANTVVYLEGAELHSTNEYAVIDQRNKQFIPRMIPVVKGQEVRFLNSDMVQHNVFSTFKKEPFDLGRYPQGQHKSLRFNVPGPHKIYCNIHQNMISDIFVLNNTLFSATDKNGNFRIKNVPPGKYVIKVWHIFGGTVEKKISVSDKPLLLKFTITSSKSVRNIKKHNNKFGKSYPVIPSCDINVSVSTK